MAKHRKRRLATIDLETDPFMYGRTIRPFMWGFFDGANFSHRWRDAPDCAETLYNFLETLDDPHLIYAHNGGRFDFLFLLPWITEPPTIISGRIVEAKLGKHTLRDSFAILPVSLKAAGEKLDIDMARLEPGVRRKHRPEITTYLEQDCRGLYDAVAAFRDRFGNSLTMAGAAMRRLKASVEQVTQRPWMNTLQKLPLSDDPKFRPWYFGGRVSCFDRGLIRDNLKIYDVNSMYPYAMKKYHHPTGRNFLEQMAVDDRTDFAIVDAWSDGALPLRAEDGGLSFPKGRGTFHATGHELRAGMELGKVRVFRVLHALRCTVKTDFADFVDEYYGLRQLARGVDPIAFLHFKLVLNSSYGRFALDPDGLNEWEVIPRDRGAWRDVMERGYELAFEGPSVSMWRRPVEDNIKARALMNVATGASITGAARAELLRGIAQAERPIYCDTDSVVCRSLDVPGGTDLGAWKLEGEADEAAIAGRKLYALFAEGEAVKYASKGVRLTPEQIREVAQGSVITWQSERPTFNVAGGWQYLRREVRMTA
jgi:hypothetical protein